MNLLSKLAMFISFFQYLTCAFSFFTVRSFREKIRECFVCACLSFFLKFSCMLLIAFIYNSVCLDLEFVKDAKRLGGDPFVLGYSYMNMHFQQHIWFKISS